MQILDDQVVLTCSTRGIADLLCAKQQDGAPADLVIGIEARLTWSGRVLRLIHTAGATSRPASASLTGLLVQAHRWWAELRKGELEIKALAKREGVTGSYMTRVVRLAFLSPAITQAILRGKQPEELGARALTLGSVLEASWSAQAERLGHIG